MVAAVNTGGSSEPPLFISRKLNGINRLEVHEAVGGQQGVGKNILIVDGEFDLVETCVRLLVRQGFACLRAYTGQQGITLIGQQHPDVVLTDLHLSDVDGLNVLRHAREHSPPIPGILMTASPSTTDNGYAVGAVQYLPKPFSNAALLEVVNRALR